jgi:CRP-like cAMP-binding protein
MSESGNQSRENLEKDVAAHPFLIGLTETHVRLLADCAMHSHFRTQEVIFREGETANRFYLIESGKVVLESAEHIGGAPVVIDTIGPGDLLGWSWIFSPHTWHFTARAALHFHKPLNVSIVVVGCWHRGGISNCRSANAQ